MAHGSVSGTSHVLSKLYLFDPTLLRLLKQQNSVHSLIIPDLINYTIHNPTFFCLLKFSKIFEKKLCYTLRTFFILFCPHINSFNISFVGVLVMDPDLYLESVGGSSGHALGWVGLEREGRFSLVTRPKISIVRKRII